MEPENHPQLQDEITVTLTREQWGTICHSLLYTVDYNKAKCYEWAHFCADKAMGGRYAAEHDRTSQAAAAVLAIIEAATTDPNAPNILA